MLIEYSCLPLEGHTLGIGTGGGTGVLAVVHGLMEHNCHSLGCSQGMLGIGKRMEVLVAVEQGNIVVGIVAVSCLGIGGNSVVVEVIIVDWVILDLVIVVEVILE